MLDAPIEDLDVGSAAPVSAPSPATPTDFDLPPFPNDGGFVGLDGFSGVHTDDGFEHLETDLQDQFSTDIQFGNMHHDEPAHDFFDCSGDGSFARSPSSAFRDGGCGLQGSSSLASSSFAPLSDQPVVTASVHDATLAFREARFEKLEIEKFNFEAGSSILKLLKIEAWKLHFRASGLSQEAPKWSFRKLQNEASRSSKMELPEASKWSFQKLHFGASGFILSL